MTISCPGNTTAFLEYHWLLRGEAGGNPCLYLIGVEGTIRSRNDKQTVNDDDPVDP